MYYEAMSYENFVLSLAPASFVPMDNIDPDLRVEDVVLVRMSLPTDATLASEGAPGQGDYSIDVSDGNPVEFE